MGRAESSVTNFSQPKAYGVMSKGVLALTADSVAHTRSDPVIFVVIKVYVKI